MDANTMSAVAKALGHPARVRIVDLLARQRECKGTEVFAELSLAQSTVSEHLRILIEAGVVDATQVGTSRVFCLRQSTLDRFALDISALAGLATGSDTSACACAFDDKGACD